MKKLYYAITGSLLGVLGYFSLASAQTATFSTTDVASVADPLFESLKDMLIFVWINYYPLIIGLGIVAGLIGWIIRKTFRH